MSTEQHDTPAAGVDRRGLLKCMSWAGAAMVWTVAGGIPRSQPAGLGRAEAAETGFCFAQVSDSHLGFDRPVNRDVIGTFRSALGQVTAMEEQPALLIHTGDLTHLSTPEQFDTGAQLLGATGLAIHTVPGEHDVLEDNGRSYLNHYGKGTQGDGWHSFDAGGVHFIGLVNVVNLQGNGLGDLGPAQLEWLGKDVMGLSSSTPIVLFAHVPLWIVYQDWGWGTKDGAQALSYLKRFGSVTVLNGHIHQVMQKVEGHVAFHTARSTAFPQGVPGVAKGPGPVPVAAGDLRKVLGTARISLVSSASPLAIVDTPLAG
ncbi:metallophosphoesterase family protein [Rhodopila sp.]|uniref:metallophosphoesterase family protein n=1 Tax=Rhodopila sp. TaxID=2480087 RepID=UPI003D13D78E